AIRRARVRHVFRRHAEIQQAMGFRRFIFRGVTKVRDEWDLPCAALNLRRLRALGVAAASTAAAHGEPAVRNGAARERGRRRSAYEAPNGSVAPGPVSS